MNDESRRSLFAFVWSVPRVQITDIRDRHVGDDPVRLVRESGIVKLMAEDEAEVIDMLKLAGGVLMEQYEAVQNNQEDATFLETVARANAPSETTSAGKAKGTDLHHDGYQFKSPYRGREIAGIGRLPDVEILAFPKVVERRCLVFSDLHSASRAFLYEDAAMFELLTRPVFTVHPRYRRADPQLLDPGEFPVVFRDRLGWRFHVGGSIQTKDPKAGYALDLLRVHMARATITEDLTPGVLYLVNQRLTAHCGIRVRGVDGQTVLRRRLVRFEDQGPAS